MATTHEIKVERREDGGKGASRRLRHAGSVPAIVYGGDLKPVSIQLSHNDVWLASQHDWFYSSILSLSLNGDVQKVLLRDMQRHPYKQQIMHLDFQRVNDKESIRTAVPLHFLGQDTSPAGKAADVVVAHELNEVVVECLPGDLPEFIELDLSNLAVGDVIHLSQLKLPKGVELPELKLGAEHDVAVVTAKYVKVEDESAEGETSADVPAAKVADDSEAKDAE
ncbi:MULTISPECIES: 50S ribosomal protein L25/general stress protein Ctc [Pseudoxanthomonas]|uniref:Large ribosomal subunit protein bL25 n=1 Tax=Pseudoxanthomonas winnipegensis TaxID=2480810 RepID=A0A4Q8M613_9GAMM|nr:MULTISPECIES: 50S ribosomal protein L25/general stress protein Ctc [Pseudoxanthomonas]MDQ1119935.1 large subunit ribosomal protein L25 [Pseudoxanthomonas winnipegensis]MDR6136861.1 large subunit ribosomal protein L25 [Pseudoxanthomonas sp. SORGH_AS_0997]RZZ85492.1 50S ribosomal protein L25/general stress protein Ctc [Pseudoxanthomonas winnipegensis]TAA45485.1 50S ribosomal protein L25/general stress protein Ctc [Pseudoxanthomonas winnipegensis]